MTKKESTTVSFLAISLAIISGIAGVNTFHKLFNAQSDWERLGYAVLSGWILSCFLMMLIGIFMQTPKD